MELKRKWRNEATRQRRIAIKQYWEEVSHDLKNNPKNFFQTFKPFLDRKDKEDSRKREIHLSINGTLEKDRLVVAEYLSEYFSSMAKGIGGEQVDDLTEGHFIEHSSLHLISSHMAESNDSFCFRPVNHYEVKDALENLNTRKAIGYEGLQPRILKIVGEELAPSLTRTLNTSIEHGTWLSERKRGI